MGLYVKQGKAYLSFKRTCQGHSDTIYIGGGLAATVALQMIAMQRQRRNESRATWEDKTRQFETAWTTAAKSTDDLENLLAAELLVGGFHRSDRHAWRKRGKTK